MRVGLVGWVDIWPAVRTLDRGVVLDGSLVAELCSNVLIANVVVAHSVMAPAVRDMAVTKINAIKEGDGYATRVAGCVTTVTIVGAVEGKLWNTSSSAPGDGIEVLDVYGNAAGRRGLGGSKINAALPVFRVDSVGHVVSLVAEGLGKGLALGLVIVGGDEGLALVVGHLGTAASGWQDHVVSVLAKNSRRPLGLALSLLAVDRNRNATHVLGVLVTKFAVVELVRADMEGEVTLVTVVAALGGKGEFRFGGCHTGDQFYGSVQIR